MEIVCVWSLTCPIMAWTSIAHGSICVHQRLDCSFQHLVLGRFYLSHFKPKWRFVNNYKGTRWRATLNFLIFYGWKWWKNECTFFESLSVCSLVYLTYMNRVGNNLFQALVREIESSFCIGNWNTTTNKQSLLHSQIKLLRYG